MPGRLKQLDCKSFRQAECIPSMAVAVLRSLSFQKFVRLHSMHRRTSFFVFCFFQCFPSTSFRSQRRADRRCEESCLPECPVGSERVPERNNRPAKRGKASLIWLRFLVGPGPGPRREGGCSEQVSPPRTVKALGRTAALDSRRSRGSGRLAHRG